MHASLLFQRLLVQLLIMLNKSFLNNGIESNLCKQDLTWPRIRGPTCEFCRHEGSHVQPIALFEELGLVLVHALSP